MKKYLLLILFLWCLFGFQQVSFVPKSALAEVKWDSASNRQDTGGSVSYAGISWQHTVGNFPNRILLVSVNYYGYPVTAYYNNVQMKQIVSASYGDNLSIWYLTGSDVPVGTGTVKITSIGAGAAAGAVSYYNVDQTTPFGPQAKTSGNTTTQATGTITLNNTTQGQLVVDTLGLHPATSSQPNQGNGQTKAGLFYYETLTAQLAIASSKQANTGNTTTSWTFAPKSGSNVAWGLVAVALNRAPNACDSLPAEIMLSVDRSSSMNSNQAVVKTAVKNFIDTMADGGQKRIGLASYADHGTLDKSLTSDYTSVKSAVDGLSFGTGSSGQPEAITFANQQLSGGRANTKRFHIHITDRDNSVAVDNAQSGWTNYQAILDIIDFNDGKFPAVKFNPVISQSGGKYYSITTGSFDQLLQQAATDLCTKLQTATPTTYSISGNVFIDTNANKILDTGAGGEANISSAPIISVSPPNAGTIATNPNGSYTISNLPAGTYVVSYNSLPTGYHMTSPLTGSQPSFQVTVGPSCSTNGAPGASCQ